MLYEISELVLDEHSGKARGADRLHGFFPHGKTAHHADVVIDVSDGRKHGGYHIETP